ncbi:S1C family serine protease [Rubritalea tangerina]|uniref:S1C family serine protease n=2 Tax=Rubritalea tangerina TaxID=430798 RepID=A0ABW4ZC23_9BACT
MIRTFGMGSVLGFMALVSCTQLALMAQTSLPTDERTNGKEVRAAFGPQRSAIQASSAVLYDGWRSFNYGIVVSEDGLILAKGSELEERKDIDIRVGEKKYTEVEIVAQNPRWDVALLKVDAEGLTPVSWAESSDVSQGTWVVANGVTSRSLRRINVGIISAKTRAVEGKAPAVLGISFKADKGSLVIEEVTKETGAEEAGIKAGDTIKKFAGEEVATREALIEIIRDYLPGDEVLIEFERDGRRLEVEVRLMARDEAYKESGSRNDAMSGDFSKRRDSFPRVLQTDIPFSARTIGGPLLTLDGKCIGMNIARANRAESFAIPVEDLKKLLVELKKEGED